MWIRYFVPEDGDDASHPNVFQVDKANTLEDIKKSFPLVGSFHFRFLKEVDKMSVWLDVTDNNSPLPTYQGGLFIKATRNRSKQSIEVKHHQNVAEVPPPAAKPVSRATSSSAATSVPPPAPTTRQPSEKLLNFDHNDDDFGGIEELFRY